MALYQARQVPSVRYPPYTIAEYQDSLRKGQFHYAFDLHYALPITAENRMLAYLTLTHQIILDEGIKAVWYITPMNIQAGIEHSPPSFFRDVVANADRIRQALEPSPVKSFCTVLSRHNFLFANECAEHLRASGRHAILEMLLPTLLS
jgi:hypothetical protein